MKKALLFFLLFLAPAALSAQNQKQQAIIHKIENAKKQYREAFDNVRIDTRIYASCHENPSCSQAELKERSQAIKTNLGIMGASLSTLTLSREALQKKLPSSP